VPSSNKACTCGHVFSPESRRILGKRFSVYRVGMRRKSSALSERKQNSAIKSEISPKKKKSLLFQTSPPSAKKTQDAPIKRLSNFTKKAAKKHSRLQVLKENCSAKTQPERLILMRTSPQKTLRLSLALAEINRRLCGQTLLWRMLSP
ncbi:hypothetical protein QZH41_013981, partial [Actinostola sp. cb2023]